jgi:hypothetical protein
VADVVMNVSPLGSMAARGVKQGAMAAGRAGEQLAERFVPQVMERGGLGAQLMGDLALGSRSQVIKPKGGNWLAGSVERAIEPMRVRVVGSDPADRLRDLDAAYAQNVEAGVAMDPAVFARERARLEPEAAMNRWLEQKLGKYIRNEMATPEDPLRALAERGIMHSEISPTGYNVSRARKEAGFPEEGMGVSDLAKTWEARADTFVNPLRASDITSGYYPEAVEANPWLLKVPPETPVYEMLGGAGDDIGLGFGHLVDELKNAINPESGLPASLRLKYSDLDKVTVPQAVERVAKINDWRAAQKAEADMARAMNPATQVVKEYPEQGFKWVELRQPKETGKNVETVHIPEELRMADEDQVREMVEIMAEDDGFIPGTPAFERYMAENMPRAEKKTVDESYKVLEDALKYEGETMGHCVGGYCPDVVEGRSRIYSLRDKKGQPHVTIEVAPREFSDIFNSLPESDRAEVFKNAPKWANDAQLLETLQNLYPEKVGPLEEIVQIKGKGNKAPNAEYLPAVQDFVRSGNWSNVGDLKNTGLVDLEKAGVPAEMRGGQRFGTQEEYDAIVRKNAEGFAQGGLVSGANFHTGDFDPARIDTIVGELHALNQA